MKNKIIPINLANKNFYNVKVIKDLNLMCDLS